MRSVALGNAYRGLKRYDDALDAFRAAKKIDRYVVAPHVASALTRVETGQIEMAVDELNHVIELDPKNLAGKNFARPRFDDAVSAARRDRRDFQGEPGARRDESRSPQSRRRPTTSRRSANWRWLMRNSARSRKR